MIDSRVYFYGFLGLVILAECVTYFKVVKNLSRAWKIVWQIVIVCHVVLTLLFAGIAIAAQIDGGTYAYLGYGIIVGIPWSVFNFLVGVGALLLVARFIKNHLPRGHTLSRDLPGPNWLWGFIIVGFIWSLTWGVPLFLTYLQIRGVI